MADYLNYEVNEGDTLRRVAGHCRHLTSGGVFSDDTPVTSSMVIGHLDASYYWLLGELARCGYNTTVTDTEAKRVLQELQALDAAVQVEYSMAVSSSGEESDRYKGMIARRDRLLRNMLESGVLEDLGQTRDRSKSKFLQGTGRSIDAKRDVRTDSDVIQPRFPKGFGKRRDVPDRSGIETSSGADPNL